MKSIAVCALVLFAACWNPVAPARTPDRVRALGEIKGYNHDDPRISLDAQGRTVSVTVTTYGGGCHTAGPTQVRAHGLVADVTPYDFTGPPGTDCTRPLLSFVHRATVQFDRAGTARIRVHGIDAGTRHAGNMRGDSVVVERTIELQ